MKRIVIAIIIISLSFFACSKGTKTAEVGEKVYKEVSSNGETFSKWLIVYSLSEYDRKGNWIYYNNGGLETWYDYDSKGNVIHWKKKDGDEGWYEYNSKGNLIHFKYSEGYEIWIE